MLTILLHSSKTMRQSNISTHPYQAPRLLAEAMELADYTQTLSVEQLMKSMKISRAMAEKTLILLKSWTARPERQLPAIDAFLGDIYSGFQAHTLTEADRAYANNHLVILSGLYGALRALDSIHPYRLEMGYRLPNQPYGNLYTFWSDRIAGLFSLTSTILNLSAVEYTKAVLPHLHDVSVITPKFLTVNQKTGQPQFVTVHAKIARGAFARWVIKNRLDQPQNLSAFSELGYRYEPSLSTFDIPVFVCDTFEGLGLSVRLS